MNAIVALKVSEAKAQFIAETKVRPDERNPEQIVKVVGKGPQPAPNPNAARRRRGPRRTSNGDDSLLAEESLPRLSDLLSGSY